MNKTFSVVLSLLILYLVPSFSQSSYVGRDEIYLALAGRSTGTLEYRDFQSNERVLLPTWLDVKPSGDGKSLEFSYTYDDGPTKTVTEKSAITIDEASHQFTLTSDRDKSSEHYGIDSAEQKGRRIKLALTGTGQENHQSVDVRITVKIDRNLYQFTKETRSPGHDFAFRDGYVFRRREP